ncbi:MAG: YggS family pyridoxal phosphate-dependent enzyme [Caulobacterales bacterium]|jgi:pyridoxal phosphate enzyme (YggS family)
MTDLSIAARRAAILDRIAAAALEAGRGPAAVALVAVAKQQPADRIEAMLAAGQRMFGENRVQEAQGRWISRRGMADLHVRLIGPLQTNKAREAVALFDAIDSLDRPKLAAALADAIAKAGRAPRLLVQVNTGAEPQKAGVLPDQADSFIGQCQREFGLTLDGLMCIPPADEPPGPHFMLVGEIAARNGLAALSMGMSEDFEQAVAAGATMVRVGGALFGPRS